MISQKYTPTNKYDLTDAHRAQFEPHTKRWIDNAMSTVAMTDRDREVCRKAVNGMYDAAKLPRPKHIVFVPSPLVLALAGSFSAAIWWMSKNGWKTPDGVDATLAATSVATRNATRVATDDATSAATYDATNVATRDATARATSGATDAATNAATSAATYDATARATSGATDAATNAATSVATDDATNVATDAATRGATDGATRAATNGATRNATYAATRNATYAATDAATDGATRAATNGATNGAADKGLSPMSRFMLQCCKNYYSMWNGGNQWSGWCAYLSFFKDVAEIDLPEYENYRHYETLTLHSGPRMVHADFCMISDRPEILKVDDQNRPHCEDGPSHRWRDGWSLWHWHGVKVEQYAIENPEKITVEDIEKEENAEVRRIKILRRGAGWYLKETQAKLVDMDARNCIGGATRALFEDKGGNRWLCGTDGSTKRVYYMPVPAGAQTCKEAHEAICGFSEDNIVAES